MASNSFVILAPAVRSGAPGSAPGPATAPGVMAPIASRKDLIRDLAAYNTGPDVDPAAAKDAAQAAIKADVLYGPGLRIDLPPGQDPVTQMLVTLIEKEIGVLVLPRIAAAFKWRVIDADTGDELNLAAGAR